MEKLYFSAEKKCSYRVIGVVDSVPQLSFFVKIPATAVTAFYFKRSVEVLLEVLPAAFGAVR